MTSYVRVLVAHKGLLRTTSSPMGSHTQRYEDGSATHYVKVRDVVNNDACGFELTAAEFHYIPEPEEILYIIARMRGRGLVEGYAPSWNKDESLNPYFDVYMDKPHSITQRGNCIIRCKYGSIYAIGQQYDSLTYTEREQQREYVLQWIEEMSDRFEEEEQFARDLEMAVAKRAYAVLAGYK